MVSDYFQRVLIGKTAIIETKYIPKNGKEVDIRITAVRIIVKNNVIGAYGIVRDITKEKKQ